MNMIAIQDELIAKYVKANGTKTGAMVKAAAWKYAEKKLAALGFAIEDAKIILWDAVDVACLQYNGN